MATTLKLDHIVIHVYDLDQAMADYAALGFTVVRGGAHPGLGSQNALIAFEDDTYLELIAFPGRPRREHPVAKERAAHELAHEGLTPREQRMGAWASTPEGLLDWALVPADIEATIAKSRDGGLHLDGPIPGGRVRPDGQKIEWMMGIPFGFDVPFLCADVTARMLRLPQGAARKHANGVLGIESLVVIVAEREASLARYTALTGQQPKVITDAAPHGRFAEFNIGPTRVILAEAGHPGNPLHAYAGRYGVGPYELRLHCDKAMPEVELDATLTHGARMAFAGS